MVKKTNIPEGYKQTDVGVIPVDWGVEKFNEVTNLITCGLAATPKYVKEEAGKPFLSAQNVRNGRVVYENYRYISNELFDQITKHNKPEKGDLLYTRVGAGIGEAGVIEDDFEFGIYVSLTLIKTDNRYLHNNFLLHLLNSPRYKFLAKNGQFAGGGVQNLNVQIVRQFLIPLPSLPEQKVIAGVLSDADALISTLEKLIAKKRNIKQGTMQQLLTGKKRLPGFSGKWEEVAIKDLCQIESGEITKGGNLNYLEIGDINIDSKTYFISDKEKLSVPGSIKVPKGTLLISTVRPTRGAITFTKETIYVSSAFCRLNNANMFLFYIVSYDKFLNYLGENSTGGTYPTCRREDILNYKCLAPKSSQEQTAIANILSDMDTEIEALEQKRDKYKAVKQGMMQELLTGRIRLVQEKAVGTSMPTVTKTLETTDALPKKSHNWQINEAVVIAALTSAFGSEQYPLGRKRYTKFSYLLHRHVEGKAEGYQKKAAGPYNPDTKYKGPEKIAQDNRYIKPHTSGEFSGFVADESIEQARGYFDKWYGLEALQWLEQLRYESNEQLELLTTVDMAVCELAKNKQSVSVAGVKDVIRSHPEWKAKLNRPIFSDENIAAAINKSQELLSV